MVKIALNLDEISVGPGNVEKGTWRSKLTACEEAESSTGNPMLIWDWEILEGPSTGMNARSWTSLLDNALGNFKVHAEAFGYHGDTEVDTDRCLNKTAMLVIGTRKRRNRDTGDEEEVSSVVTVRADPNASNGKVASGAGVRRLGGSKATAKTTGDDDLPF